MHTNRVCTQLDGFDQTERRDIYQFSWFLMIFMILHTLKKPFQTWSKEQQHFQSFCVEKIGLIYLSLKSLTTFQTSNLKLGHRMPQFLRFDNIYSDIFTPRSYQVRTLNFEDIFCDFNVLTCSLIGQCFFFQVELLHKAVQRNTIICLGSGTGKVFISCLLIRELAQSLRKRLEDGGKRTIYLVKRGNQFTTDFGFINSEFFKMVLIFSRATSGNSF